MSFARRVKRAAAALLLLLAAGAAFTGWALESDGVAALETERADGGRRETHVWWVEREGGAVELEAATPERVWLAEALAAPEVMLERDGRRERFRAERRDDSGVRENLRAALREKYGLRDAWVGLFQDTSRAVVVRLVPLAQLRFDRSPETAAADLPFSDAVRAGGLVFVSGQLGVRPGERDVVPGGIEAETAQALHNIRAILERNGSSLAHVVKCTAFLADMADWPRMNEVYRRYFPDALPARSALAAAGLAVGARIELECIAAAPDGR
jgi:2-iminobutanoate/2-iminopropanoate deaminase